MAESIVSEASNTSKRKLREKFIHENKIYTLNKETRTAYYYRCKTNETIRVTEEHICLVTSFECDVVKAKYKIKEFALENPFLAPSKVILEVQQDFTTTVLQALPKNSSISRNIRIYRRPRGFKEPTKRSEIMFTEEQMKTSEGKQFLLHDSNDERRILIFATDKGIQELAMCNTWAIDGTFDVVSNLYTQLLTIHGLPKNGWIWMVVQEEEPPTIRTFDKTYSTTPISKRTRRNRLIQSKISFNSKRT